MSGRGAGPATSPTAAARGDARPSVWALAGGKGGVGRSLLAANIGIQLARAGRRVVLVDLDLQGANLQAYLGHQRLPRTLADFASGRVALLSELACETPTAHLRIVGGIQRADLRDDPVHFVRQVAEQFATLSADQVLVDCGSGRAPSTIAAFAEANLGILVTSPEPAALEALYLFAEAHLRWCLVRALTGERMAAVEDKLRAAGTDPARLHFRGFMTRLAAIDPPAREAVAAVIRRTRLELLVNQVRGEADEEAAPCMASGFRKCFGINLRTAGTIEHDLSILQAVQKRRSLSQQYPNAASTKGIARAATRLLSSALGPVRDADEEWEDLGAVDHYRVLEVVPRASAKEVQSAYQLLKKTYDPETTVLSSLIDAPGLRELQARIEAAYRTLIFLESRSDYDRRLKDGERAPREGRAPASGSEPEAAKPAAETSPADAKRGTPSIPEASGQPGAAGSSLEMAGGGFFSAAAGDQPSAAPAPLTRLHATVPPPSGTPPPSATPDEPRGAGESVATVTEPRDGNGHHHDGAEAGATDGARSGQAEAPSPSFALPASGADLRGHRERLRLSLEGIAEKTKIRRTYLQAIEEERFADLPAAVFVRGFLREYARSLGLPGGDVIALYMKRYQDWHESRGDASFTPSGG